MARAKLTALAVERAHRSGEPVLLSDGASWTLRYRFAGKEHWLTLGHYPDMSLAQARIEARQARVLLDRQQNPLSVRREVAERCLGHKLRGVEGTYDRHDYFKERRTALESWTTPLLTIERGEYNVAPLRRWQQTG